MTPKEKAKQLFNKYYSYLKANLMNDEEAIEDAKHCALIAVEEVRNFHTNLFYASKGSIFDIYLDNVKHEILNYENTTI